MIVKPKSRAALVLFGEVDVMADLLPVEGSEVCQIIHFETSIVIDNVELVWAGESPRDVVILCDYRPQASNLHSVLKGSSGEIQRYNIDYSQKGIRGIFYLRSQPQRNPVFTQGWRFHYSLMKRKVIVSADRVTGVVVTTT